MRLLHTRKFSLKEFDPGQEPPYAILSHTWGDREIVYDDLVGQAKWSRLAGADKIRASCERANLDKFDYIWIDTCCINKSSSAELQEAINSMFSWYKSAAVCYVFIGDFKRRSPRSSILSDVEKIHMKRSRWFTRGWTLQELLAPSNVIFYDHDWDRIGSKLTLVASLSRWTGIPQAALCGRDLHKYTVADRMAWAKERQTRRPEDLAYSLLGIFDVSMPMIYGEGKERAFRRLIKEIVESDTNNSSVISAIGSQKQQLQGRKVSLGIPLTGNYGLSGPTEVGKYNFPATTPSTISNIPINNPQTANYSVGGVNTMGTYPFTPTAPSAIGSILSSNPPIGNYGFEGVNAMGTYGFYTAAHSTPGAMPGSSVQSLLTQTEANDITDPRLAKLGIRTSGSITGYRVRRPGKDFFRRGKVFKILWPTIASPDQAHIYDTAIVTKIRWFIVVISWRDACICLPINTYNRSGVAKSGIVKSDHAIAYSSRDEPQAGAGELSPHDENGRMMAGIRITPKHRDDKLDRMARIDFSRTYTVEHKAEVYDFGDVHRDYLDRLIQNWLLVIKAHVHRQSIGDVDG